MSENPHLDETREMVRLRLDEGWSYSEIAEWYGFRRQTVHQRLARYLKHEGKLRHGSPGKRTSDAETLEMHERLMARKTTVREEAERLGISEQSVRTRMRKLGLPIRFHRSQHGSYSRYVHHHCRCDLCKEAAREAWRRRAANDRARKAR